LGSRERDGKTQYWRTLLNYLERKHGKQRPRIYNFVENAQSRPRVNMGCSAIEEEEEGGPVPVSYSFRLPAYTVYLLTA
jgi:hypothetical protein